MADQTSFDKESLRSFDTLVNIIARLRSPEGCPWDRKQTHESLKPNLLEESYEVMETIDRNSHAELCQELGDLLLQIVLHAQIASDEKQFAIEDVIESINTKLIHRHPHIFGDEIAGDIHDVVQRWEDLKRQERGNASVLEGLPQGMPALAYSQAMQRRAARVGFDWESKDEIIDKLAEEIKEYRQATDKKEQEDEFGDMLLTMANIARRQEINAEDALRKSNEKFRRRFCYMEEVCDQRGIALASLPLKEQDILWEEAKHALDPGRGERI